ncbi:MAG: MFS transporter [Candidatus Vogelbacteria bacterium]|nr:MFS transporter [Candidatus Vogelbacteria bacterium]
MSDRKRTAGLFVGTIYILTFFLTVQYALTVYINSSFLKQFFAESEIGFIYTAGSLAAIICLARISEALRRYGQFRLAFLSMFFNLIVLTGLAMINLGLAPIFIVLPSIFVLFVLLATTTLLNRFFLAFYLEEFTKNTETGNNQGIFLTTMNLAIALAPFVVGKILSNGDYHRLYLLASFFLIISMIIFVLKLIDIKDIPYNAPPFMETGRRIWHTKNIYNIFASNFLLEFFYSWMTIYTPIYLNNNLGFSWSEIGTMFSLMLTPFVILQYPLGKIADRYLGEKEILTAGFIIMAVATGALSFITVNSFWVWTGILFATRVGASAIEVMNETYFYKKVRPVDSDIMSFYRNAQPLAYIAGPALASVFLMFLDFKYIFLTLGIIMLGGVYFSLGIKDTK